MKPTRSHIVRVKEELQQAGVGRYGRLKFTALYLPNVIHEQEHIQAVVYGRYGEGMLMTTEAMLVATDRRVIFLDHKPGYTNVDELSYDVISGVRMSNAAFFTSVTLHTKIGEFAIKFAKRRCAERFVEYIETRRVEAPFAPRVIQSL